MFWALLKLLIILKFKQCVLEHVTCKKELEEVGKQNIKERIVICGVGRRNKKLVDNERYFKRDGDCAKVSTALGIRCGWEI